MSSIVAYQKKRKSSFLSSAPSRGAKIAPRTRSKRGFVRGKMSMYRNLSNVEYPYVVTTAPLNICITTGTVAQAGIIVYADASIPVAGPAAANAKYDVELNFSLQQMNCTFNNGNPASLITAAVPNYTEFTNLYDEYKIDKVELLMYYNANSLGAERSLTQGLPVMLVVNDFDDSTAPTLSSITQYPGLRSLQFGNNNVGVVKHAVYPTPQIAVENQAGAIISAGDFGHKGWFGTANYQIPHFGVKMLYDNQLVGTGAYMGFITVYARYYIKFRHPR